MHYTEDDMLMLSGIQHFVFCPRQWALIHLDQQWNDNRLTTEGQIMHKRVDDPFYRQKCGPYICLRSVQIASKELGLYGFTDVVELHPAQSDDNTIEHPDYPGQWTPFPIEYKHGRSKPDNRDKVQLMAQAICLEEQYGIKIDAGALFYGETNHREIIVFDDALREQTIEAAQLMHEIFRTGQLPQAEKRPHCANCSLIDICLPQTARCKSVEYYLKSNLYEEAT